MYRFNSYQETRKAAVQLLKLISKADLNGKPVIVLEKEEGAKANIPPPQYS